MDSKIHLLGKGLSLLLLYTIILFAVAQAQSLTIAVRDSAGNSLRGASVLLIGTQHAGSTNSEGEWQLSPVRPGQYRGIVRCAGFTTDTFAVFVTDSAVQQLTVYLHRTEKVLANVLVTAISQRRLSRELPGPVVTITPAAVRQTTESNIIDVLVRNTPGLQAVKTGANISKPVIRGLGYNRVLVLYDGLRQEGQQWGDEHGIEADAYGIEKAVVIKGPASLMYGSDALAGVVSLTPETPKEDQPGFTGKYTTEYQHNNHLLGQAIAIGWNSKHWILGLNGSGRLATNYRNAIDGRVYNTGFSEKNAAITLIRKSKQHSPELRLTWYDNLQGIPDGSRDSISRRFTYQVAEGDNDDIRNRPPITNEQLHSYRLSPLHQHIQHYRAYLQDGFRFHKLDVDVLAGWQQNRRREYNHPTRVSLAGMNVRLNSFHYGINSSLPIDSQLNIQSGISGMLQQNKSGAATDFPIPDYQLHEEGMYAGFQWKKAGWTITGGIRYDQRIIRWNDFYTRVDPATGFGQQVFFPDTTGADLSFSAFKKNYHGWSGSLGGIVDLGKAISLKASIGRGYRSPNITEMASNGLDPGAHIVYLGNREFIPEFSLQEDLGLIINTKSIHAELSLFNNNLRNYIYLNMLTGADGLPITDAQGNRTFQYKQAAARLYGLEAWIAWQPRRSGFKAESSLAIVYGKNRMEQYKGKGTAGEYLPLMPPAALRNRISQQFGWTNRHGLKLRPKIETESAFRQDRYLSLNNTESATAAYTLIHTGFTATIDRKSGQPIEIICMINNLFDAAYQSHLSRLKYLEYYQQSPNGKSGIYNMGRNVCVKLIIGL